MFWALAALAAGEGLKFASTWAEGNEAEEQGKIAKSQAFQEAEAVKMSGRDEALQMRHEAERFKASQIATISANGGMLTGSALLVVAESAKNFELDALTSERNYMVNATNIQNRGILAEYEGKVAKKNARLRAFGSLLGTAGQSYLSYKKNA